MQPWDFDFTCLVPEAFCVGTASRVEAETLNTLATWCEELTHLKRPWCWERFKAGEGDDRGWDGWMASPTQWRWIWVNSGSWWWTGRPGVLWSMGSLRVGHNWGTELNWTVSRLGEKKFWWTLNDILSVSTSSCVWSPQTVQLQKPVNSDSLSWLKLPWVGFQLLATERALISS